jgi:hypothetical protein
MQRMARTSTLSVWDQALDGRLIPLMRDMRDRGATYDEISDAARALGVTATRSTIYRWCRGLCETVAS